MRTDRVTRTYPAAGTFGTTAAAGAKASGAAQSVPDPVPASGFAAAPAGPVVTETRVIEAPPVAGSAVAPPHRERRRRVPTATATRKGQHLRINLHENVQAKGIDAGFDRYRFVHNALPDLDLSGVDTSTTLFGRSQRTPLLISCMTGGTPEAGRINMILAQTAETLGLAMGLGSGRVLIERPDLLDSFAMRPYAPHTLLFANLGAVQLNRGVSVDDCRRLLDQLDADALVLHLNPLQEALQPEGDATFSGLLPRIAALCARLERPVVVKEVGWGLAPDVVRSLFDAGVHAVDVAGAGGTSWSEVERHRLSPAWRQRVAAQFGAWGIPTAEALRGARQNAPHGLVFASGGVRSGIDVAKAIALGADLIGVAGPFLRAAHCGHDAAHQLGEELIATLRTVMFCVGARTLADLRTTRRLCDTRSPPVFSDTLHYQTSAAPQFIDITNDVQAVVARAGLSNGQAHVYAQHTTVAIRLNEGEPRLLRDFVHLLDSLAPAGGYLHDDLDARDGIGPDEPINGHSHCRQLLLGSSETVPVIDGRLALGTWQRLLLIELCSPRARRVTVQVRGD